MDTRTAALTSRCGALAPAPCSTAPGDGGSGSQGTSGEPNDFGAWCDSDAGGLTDRLRRGGVDLAPPGGIGGGGTVAEAGGAPRGCATTGGGASGRPAPAPAGLAPP